MTNCPSDEHPKRPARMTTLRMRELLAQLNAATQPGEGHEPSRALAESGRTEVFGEFIWRMHNHPSPEVRYWCCYWLSWENTPSAELVEVLERQSEYPEIRGQAAEGLAYALGNARRNLAWARRAETALINALDDPAVEVRWWPCFALGAHRSQRAVPRLRNVAGLVDRGRGSRGRAPEHRRQGKRGPGVLGPEGMVGGTGLSCFGGTSPT